MRAYAPEGQCYTITTRRRGKKAAEGRYDVQRKPLEFGSCNRKSHSAKLAGQSHLRLTLKGDGTFDRAQYLGAYGARRRTIGAHQLRSAGR